MFDSARKHFKLYKKFVRAYIKKVLIYKTDFILGTANQILGFAASLTLIGLIFTQIESING